MDLEGEGFLENRGLPQVVNKAVSRGDFKWPEQFPAFGVGLVDLQHFGMQMELRFPNPVLPSLVKIVAFSWLRDDLLAKLLEEAKEQWI